MTFRRHAVLLLLAALAAEPALAGAVTPPGLDEFVNLGMLVFGILAVSGLVAGILSRCLHRWVLFVPPVCAFAWTCFACPKYYRDLIVWLVLLGLVLYALCYGLGVFGLFLFRALTKKGRQSRQDAARKD